MTSFSFAIEPVTKKSHCSVNRNQMIGYWKSDGDNGFFQEFLLENDGSFSSWLHQRPEMNGTWLLDNCVFKIVGPMSFAFRVVSFQGKKVTLFDIEDKTTSVFRWMGKP
jgi:hypothetical protein